MHKKLVILAALLLSATSTYAADPYTLAKTLHVGGDGGWDYLTLSPDGKYLYAPRKPLTQIVDTQTGAIAATIPGFLSPHGCALVPTLHRGFISDGDRTGNPGITLFDTESNKPLAKIKTPADSDGIIFDEPSNHVFVVSGDGHSVIPIPADIDPAKPVADPAIELPGAPEFLASDNLGKIFINLSDTNQVAVVDTKSQKLINKFPTAPGGDPTGMSIDRDHHQIFLGCRKPAELVVMSTDDGHIIAHFPIGAGVDATAFDAPYAFASCADGTLTIIKQIDPDHYELAGVVKTAPGARTMAVDPQTHTLYLATADMETPAPTTTPSTRPARPRPVAGTFKLLVLTRN